MYGLSPSAAAMAAAAAAAGSAHSPSSAAAAAMYGFPPPSSPHSSHLAAHNPFYTPPELPPWCVMHLSLFRYSLCAECVSIEYDDECSAHGRCKVT